MDLSRLRGKLPEAEGDPAIATRPGQEAELLSLTSLWKDADGCVGSRTPGGLPAPTEPPSCLRCPPPQGFLLGVHHFLASLRNSLSFVQREEAREGLRVLTIEVALLRWLEKKLAKLCHL